MDELLQNHLFATHAIAASGSVVFGTALTYPLDTIKSLIQVPLFFPFFFFPFHSRTLFLVQEKILHYLFPICLKFEVNRLVQVLLNN